VELRFRIHPRFVRVCVGLLQEARLCFESRCTAAEAASKTLLLTTEPGRGGGQVRRFVGGGLSARTALPAATWRPHGTRSSSRGGQFDNVRTPSTGILPCC